MLNVGALKGRGLPSRLGAPRSRLRAVPSESGEDRHRRSTNWYHTPEWTRLRKAVLRRDGLFCAQTGVALVGRYPAWNSPVVDHKVPHRGDRELFFDIDNLQVVSKQYHDSVKQRLEKRGDI